MKEKQQISEKNALIESSEQSQINILKKLWVGFYNLPIILNPHYKSLLKEKQKSDLIVAEARKQLSNRESKSFIQFLETGNISAHNRRIEIKNLMERCPTLSSYQIAPLLPNELNIFILWRYQTDRSRAVFYRYSTTN